MTKEEFEVLQLDLQQSGKSIKDYLQEAGVNYSTYNYWRKKLLSRDNPKPELAPISFTQHADPVFSSSVPTGATLLFPNGLRAHFGGGTEGFCWTTILRRMRYVPSRWAGYVVWNITCQMMKSHYSALYSSEPMKVGV